MTRHVTLTAAALTLLIGTIAARSQQGLPPSPAGGASQPQSPTAAPTGTGTQDPAGGRGALGRGRSMTEPDFSKKPPVRR